MFRCFSLVRPLILVSLWMDSPHLINVETKEVFVLKEEGDDGEVSFLSSYLRVKALSNFVASTIYFLPFCYIYFTYNVFNLFIYVQQETTNQITAEWNLTGDLIYLGGSDGTLVILNTESREVCFLHLFLKLQSLRLYSDNI